MSDCIEWRGARTKFGYGKVKRGGKTLDVHRLAYAEAHGPIPPGMYVCHRCDNPACHNVDHLFLGTQGDNLRDAYSKGRRRSRNQNGAANGNAGISEQTAVRIKMLRGVVAANLVAAWVGLTPAQVGRIMKGQAWARVSADTRYS